MLERETMKNLFSIGALVLSTFVFSGTASARKTKAPEGAKVYIVSPKNGDTVKSPVRVVFGLEQMGVAPAGVKIAKTGHHHLLVNVDKLPNMNIPLPNNKNHIHFGGGQTETTVELEPGKHTLQLLLGDHAHIPHDPPIISEKITITVKK